MENTDEVVQEAVDKLVGLKTYWVYASEEVQYAVKIQAVDEEAAWEMVSDEEVHFTNDDIVDGNHFEIYSIEEDISVVNSTKGETK